MSEPAAPDINLRFPPCSLPMAVTNKFVIPSSFPPSLTGAQSFVMGNSDVPLELWAEIFLQVASNTKIKLTDQVQILCLVCKAWREAALAIPRIWANVRIDDFDGSVNFDKVGAWLERSGGVPKSLGLNENWEAHRACALPARGLAKLFMEGPALDTLTFRCFSVECLQTIFNIWQTPSTSIQARGWDSLRSIEMWISSWGDDPCQPAFLQHLPPALKSLTLRLPDWQDVPFYDPPPTIAHPNLTSFQLKCDFAPSWVVQTITSCPNLESLTLRLDPCGEEPPGPPFDLTKVHRHTSLRNLHLMQRHIYNPYTSILLPLSLPSLVELKLSMDLREGYEDEDTEWITDQLQFVIGGLSMRSGHWIHLRHFRMHGPFSFDAQGVFDLTTALRALPHVTHVVLAEIDFDPLALFPNTFEALPNLQNLELVGMSDVFNDSALLPFIQKRRERDEPFAFTFQRLSEMPPPPSSPLQTTRLPFRIQSI